MLTINEREDLIEKIRSLLAQNPAEIYIGFIFEKVDGVMLIGNSSKTTKYKKKMIDWLKRI